VSRREQEQPDPGPEAGAKFHDRAGAVMTREGAGRNGEPDFHNEKRSNETHASATDPDARLARRSNGEGAKLALIGIC
jgi:hypothetical protein